MNTTGPAMQTQAGAPAPTLAGLALGFWRRLQLRLRPRKRSLETMSDHLLADLGLNRPGYAQPTLERYIHR